MRIGSIPADHAVSEEDIRNQIRLQNWAFFHSEEEARFHAHLLTEMTGDHCEVRQVRYRLFEICRYDSSGKRV
jgi:hypothetical protein